MEVNRPIFPLDFELVDEPYWHGTSDALPVADMLLPPYESGVVRDDKTEFKDKVYFTNSKLCAIRYAKKACQKFGGNPVVYRVEPIGEVWNVKDCEFVADAARIEERIACGGK